MLVLIVLQMTPVCFYLPFRNIGVRSLQSSYFMNCCVSFHCFIHCICFYCLLNRRMFRLPFCYCYLCLLYLYFGINRLQFSFLIYFVLSLWLCTWYQMTLKSTIIGHLQAFKTFCIVKYIYKPWKKKQLLKKSNVKTNGLINV